ncbi:MAG: hypothetical protein LCH34_11700 [Firmicutes bacterium]|nr:hypothetical protein [Bacillota bacterium]
MSNYFCKEYEDLYESIQLKRKILSTLSGRDLTIFKKMTHRNLVLSIYTSWDNVIKRSVYDSFVNYKEIIVDASFIKKYFKSVNEKRYVYADFISNISDNQFLITLENLCFSNNLNSKELFELLKRMKFDVNALRVHILKDYRVASAINNLKESGVALIFKGTERPQNIFEYFIAYLDLLIESRNSIAHKYEDDYHFNIDQLDYYLKFIICSTITINEYIQSQVLIKAQEKKVRISNRFYPLKVIRSSDANGRSIIGIRNISSKVFSKDTILYCYDKTENIYREVKIAKIMKNSKEVQEILPYEDYSLEVYCQVKIKSEVKFKICAIRSTSLLFNYQIIV